jgi:DNA-binding transcriptional LysR family regulator
VHVAVRIGELQDSTLIARRIGAARSITCASPAYLRSFGVPETPEELIERDGVTFHSITPFTWSYLHDGVLVMAEPRARVSVNSGGAAVAMAKAGLGITRALDYRITPELRSGALAPILEAFETAPLPINLVFSTQGRLPLKVRAFLDWMTPRLRARLAGEGVGAPPAPHPQPLDRREGGSRSGPLPPSDTQP